MDKSNITWSANEQKRLKKIKSILDSGKIVRFSMEDIGYKDLENPSIDEDGDMVAFRMSTGMESKYICWHTQMYKISAVER